MCTQNNNETFYVGGAVGGGGSQLLRINITPNRNRKREWEGIGVILPGVDGTGFSPSFFVGLGRDEINFCGSGTGEV